MKRFLLLLAALIGLSSSPAFAVLTSTAVGNANYTVLITDSRLVPTVALTATRTWTLPSAGATQVGTSPQGPQFLGPVVPYFEISDTFGNVGGSNSCLIIAAQSGETINGASSLFFCSTFGRVVIEPLGGSQWLAQIFGSEILSGATVTLTSTNASLNAATTNPTLYVTSAPLMTTQVPAQVASVLLTPGDWDCRGVVATTTSGLGANPTQLAAWISATNPTNMAAPPNFNITPANGVTSTPGAVAIQTAAVVSPAWQIAVPPTRVTVSSTVSAFLGAVAQFAGGGLGASGRIDCYRYH